MLSLKDSPEYIALSKFIKGLGLKVLDVEPDGNCQFYAISDQLKRKGEVYSPEQLRRLAVNFWRNPANQAKFACDVHYEVNLSFKLTDKNWEHFCKVMSENKVWGDNYTLFALANVTSSCISIFSSRGTINNVTPYEPPRQMIQLGHMFENYYSSVLPGISYFHFTF